MKGLKILHLLDGHGKGTAIVGWPDNVVEWYESHGGESIISDGGNFKVDSDVLQSVLSMAKAGLKYIKQQRIIFTRTSKCKYFLKRETVLS